MRKIQGLIILVIFLPSLATAAGIYGRIFRLNEQGHRVPIGEGGSLEIFRISVDDGREIDHFMAGTDIASDGSYSIATQEQGRFKVRLTYPEIPISGRICAETWLYLYPEPKRYNLMLRNRDGSYYLQVW